MAQHSLNAQIVLSGRLDNSFGKLVSGLDNMGNRSLALASSLNNISQPIINAGKEITNLYKGYDDTIKYIQAVGDLTQEELTGIEQAARTAGKTTVCRQPSGASPSYGAEAGLTYKENIDLLPVALNMATAGQMELETATDQLLTALYSTGTPLTGASGLVDQLAAAASSSKTDIESMGEAIVRLGGISRYAKGGTQELFTMLAMMAQRGQEGSEAGTYLRNVILALVAPTKKASQVMMELGATEAELDEALEGVDLGTAAKQMDELKLEVYDASGNLRPFIDILMDLDRLTAGMTDEERNNALGNLFPKRTLSAATNLLGELEVSYDRISGAVQNADGTAQRMADTMESGLGGALRRLTNAAEELKLSFGEVLDDRVMQWSQWLQQGALALASLPEGAKGTIVDIASVLAGMGPAALIVGMGLKGIASIIGFIGSPAGAVATGVLALGVLATHLAIMGEMRTYNAIKQRFGELEVDSGTLKERVQALDGGFGKALENLGTFGTGADTAGEKYSALLQTLSGNLLDASIFNRALTKEEAASLQGIGASMVAEVQAGIRSRQMEVTGFVELLFGEQSDEGAAITGVLDGYFAGLYLEAASIGETIRAKIAEGLKGDNELSPEETEAIMAEVKRLNEVQAQIQDLQNAADVEALLQKGMRLGPEAYTSTLSELQAQRDKQEADAYSQQDQAIGYYIAAARKEGKAEAEIQAEVKRMRDLTEGLVIRNNESNRAAVMGMVNNTAETSFGDFETTTDTVLKMLELEKQKNPYMDQTEEANVLYRLWMEQSTANGIDYGDTQTFLNSVANPFMNTIPRDQLINTRDYYEKNNLEVPAWVEEAENMYNMISVILSADTNQTMTDDRSLFSSETLENVDVGALMNAGYGDLITQAGGLGEKSAAEFDARFQARIRKANLGISFTVPTGGGGTMTAEEYALGGRATDASIFGEAGPEWAIPERHDGRTADLLDSAREASGFSWPELIARTGGLNAGGTVYNNTKFVYAPQVHANDAAGVEEVLRADKERVKEIMREIQEDNDRLSWG